MFLAARRKIRDEVPKFNLAQRFSGLIGFIYWDEICLRRLFLREVGEHFFAAWLFGGLHEAKFQDSLAGISSYFWVIETIAKFHLATAGENFPMWNETKRRFGGKSGWSLRRS
jgi:hypothetical protein